MKFLNEYNVYNMIIQIIITILIFFLTKYIIYIATDKGLPSFLNYKPYSCYRCMGFWSLIFIYINLFIISNYSWWYLIICGTSLTILDVIALSVAENNAETIE